jgi:hypothetical protein
MRHHPMMSAVTGAVVAVGLGIALFAGPIYRFCERAAEQVVSPETYAEHVEGT